MDFRLLFGGLLALARSTRPASAAPISLRLVRYSVRIFSR